MAGGVNPARGNFGSPSMQSDWNRMARFGEANAAGLSRWPGIMSDYFSRRGVGGLLSDTGDVISGMVQSAWEDPVGFAADVTPVLGETRSGSEADSIFARIEEARAAGDESTAQQLENMLPLVSLGAVPVVGGLLGSAERSVAKGAVKAAGKKAAGKTEDQLLQEALATPRKISQRGTYVGALPGVNTPEAEATLINDIFNRVKNYTGTGEVFYDDFQKAIRQNTEDPVMARRFVSSSGHTSNQMSPLPNTTHAAKAMNQFAVGDPVLAGLYPNTSGPKAAESMATDRLSPDPKTGQYSYALLPPELRPADFGDYAWGGERAVRGRAVHDTWDKEAFGYARGPDGKHSAASDTEHVFMDRAYNKIANMVARDPALRARYGTGPQAYERIQAALWDIARGNADKFDVLPADEIIRRHMGFTQMAAIPGPSTGVVQGLLDAPLDVKREYTDEMFNAFSTPGGRNIPAAALGMTPVMKEGFGPWQGMMEPNRSIEFMSGANGSGGDKVIDPASAKAAKTMRDWNQFMLGQEGSGFTYPSDAGATRKASDLVTIGGVKLDGPGAYDKAMKAVSAVYGPQWADHVVVQPVPGTGELMLKNISGRNNQEFAKMAQSVSSKLGGTKVGGMRDIGNDFTYVQFNDPSYRGLMDETRNNPVLKRTFDQKVLPHIGKLQQVSEKWAKKMGVPADTVPDRVRRIFMQAGENWPQAMDEAVKKGIIPAAATTFLYGAMQGQFAGEEGTQ